MNIGKLASVLALAASLGAAAPALADNSGNGPGDETGLTSLGIDISAAGGSAQSVGTFLAGLSPDTQRSVLDGCQTAIANPVGYAPNVIAFCNTATGGALVGGQALGYAPVAQVEPAQADRMPVLQPDTGEAY